MNLSALQLVQYMMSIAFAALLEVETSIRNVSHTIFAKPERNYALAATLTLSNYQLFS